MPVPFGFSVGDFVSCIGLVRKVIAGLEESPGATAEYNSLVNELKILKSTLSAIKDLKVDNETDSTKLKAAAAQIESSIEAFLSKIYKYDSSFRPSTTRKLRDNLRKVQWVLFSKEDVKKFQAEIQGQTVFLQLYMTRLQMYATFFLTIDPILNTNRESATARSDSTNELLNSVKSKANMQVLGQTLIVKALLR
jgi:hypothetical protein